MMLLMRKRKLIKFRSIKKMRWETFLIKKKGHKIMMKAQIKIRINMKMRSMIKCQMRKKKLNIYLWIKIMSLNILMKKKKAMNKI